MMVNCIICGATLVKRGKTQRDQLGVEKKKFYRERRSGHLLALSSFPFFNQLSENPLSPPRKETLSQKLRRESDKVRSYRTLVLSSSTSFWYF